MKKYIFIVVFTLCISTFAQNDYERYFPSKSFAELRKELYAGFIKSKKLRERVVRCLNENNPQIEIRNEYVYFEDYFKKDVYSFKFLHLDNITIKDMVIEKRTPFKKGVVRMVRITEETIVLGFILKIRGQDFVVFNRNLKYIKSLLSLWDKYKAQEIKLLKITRRLERVGLFE